VHVTNLNTTDVRNVAEIVDQIIMSQSIKQTLMNSIHPNPSLIYHPMTYVTNSTLLGINQKKLDYIAAATIPGSNRLEKLNHIQHICQSIPGF